MKSRELKKIKHPIVLCIGGSDPSGGAGIQADMKTATLGGSYAMGVISCITFQNSQGFSGCVPLSVEHLRMQLQCVLDDITPDAVKTGMLPSAAIIEEIAEIISDYNLKNIVVDPIVKATLDKDKNKYDSLIAAYIEHLFPLSNLVMPNLDEMNLILKEKFNLKDKYLETFLDSPGPYMKNLNCETLLLKGGHGDGDNMEDILISKEDGLLFRIESSRILTTNLHGTGCMYSTLVATYLSQGASLDDAVCRAHKVVKKAIKDGVNHKIGKGNYGPLNFNAINQQAILK